jgi:hypothetical protein
MAFDCLNDLQKKQDPLAYESEAVKTIKASKKIDNLGNLKAMKAQEIDKALFDFDEEIDDLDRVETRYPPAEQKKVPVRFQVK